jgi:hypothetical protein
MSLRLSQQQVLDAIDSDLQTGEPHLASMFTIFTRLSAGEGMPQQESLPVPARPRWGSRLRTMLTRPFSRNRRSDGDRHEVPRNLPAT